MRTDTDQPNKMVKVDIGAGHFFTVVVLVFCVFLCSIIWYKYNADKELIQDQQELFKTTQNKLHEYVLLNNKLYMQIAFFGGQLVEQSNIFKHKCFEVAELFEDHLLKQKQMISQFVLPRREGKE